MSSKKINGYTVKLRNFIPRKKFLSIATSYPFIALCERFGPSKGGEKTTRFSKNDSAY